MRLIWLLAVSLLQQVSECVDLPWEIDFYSPYYGNVTLPCGFFRNATLCLDDAVKYFEFEKKTISDACCLCGGGVVASRLQNKLISWKITAFGHEATPTEFEAPACEQPGSIAAVSRAFKCDQCLSNSYDCNSCVENDCARGFLGPEVQISEDSGSVELAIPDNAAVVTSEISLEASDTVLTGSVFVYLDLTNLNREGLSIRLKSPSGTIAWLARGGPGQNAKAQGLWQLATLQYWREQANGAWTLQILNDGTRLSSGGCQDMDWEYAYKLDDKDEIMTCFDFQTVTNCKDDNQVSQSVWGIMYENIDIGTACCACGGGLRVRQELRSWKLEVNGHEGGENVESTQPDAQGKPISDVDPTESSGKAWVRGLGWSTTVAGFLLLCR